MLNVENIGNIMLALLLTLSLMLSLAYLVKMLKRKVGVIKGGRIKALETYMIGNKEKIMLFEVEGEKILIGINQHNINTLERYPIRKTQKRVKKFNRLKLARVKHHAF